jgi:hypothetical protein
MKNTLSCFIVLAGLLTSTLFINSPSFSQKKLAQTGFQFLSVGTNARATAMGEAYTTVDGSASALFYNPAGMAKLGSFANLSINQMEWIADINYYSGSFALNFQEGKYGVIGLSFLSVDYGEFLWTRVAPEQEQGFEDIGEAWPDPGSFMIGLGYAKDLSDKFSVGGQIKYVNQNLGKSLIPVYEGRDNLVGTEEQDYNLNVLAFDFGTLYKTGFKSLVFGMSVRNFSQEVKYEKESFQLPLTFKIGISFNVLDYFSEFGEDHSFLISADAAHPRSYPEYVNFGGEYIFMDIISIRGGYISGQDEYSYTAGFGVRKFGFGLDYSYTPFNIFDTVNRFSVEFSF